MSNYKILFLNQCWCVEIELSQALNHFRSFFENKCLQNLLEKVNVEVLMCQFI